MRATRSWRVAAPVSALLLLAAACGGDGGDDGDVTIDYWLWDDRQIPQYQECADAFAEQSGIQVEITQYVWEDYWSNLNTQFTARRAPDVFTDHLAYYPSFVENEVILPLDEYVERDNVDIGKFFPGLAELWLGQDGQRYGLPKDWDTVAIGYNSAHLQDAGLTGDDLWNATWNPTDGGSFEDVIARLSVDENGVRGDEPGFDPDNVAIYGLSFDNPSNSASGQTSWGNFARTLGFELLADGNPWGTDYQFDDPRLADTLDWFARVIDAGYLTPLADLQGVGYVPLFEAGDVALAINGSWAISSLTSIEGVEVGFAPLPEGPAGRWSIYNGLADSISANTEHPEQAWEWVKYLASEECQNVVGEQAVVFPAIPASLEIGEQARAEVGLDVSAYTTYLEQEHTFLHPVTANFDQVTQAVGAAVDQVLLGERPAAEALADAQRQVDSIMGQ